MSKYALLLLLCGFSFSAQSQNTQLQTKKIDSLNRIRRILQFEYDSAFKAFQDENKELITELSSIDSLILAIKTPTSTSKNKTVERVNPPSTPKSTTNTEPTTKTETASKTEPKATSTNPDTPAPEMMTEIEVLKSEHHYGTINDGDVVKYTFIVKNIGAGDLLIKDVKVSCGCTVPDWSKDAIKSGESTNIFVTFNSKDKGLKGTTYEYASKITVVANTEPKETYLVLRGLIKK